MSRRPTNRNTTIPGLSSARDAASRFKATQSGRQDDHATEILRAAEEAKATDAAKPATPRRSVKRRKPSSR